MNMCMNQKNLELSVYSDHNSHFLQSGGHHFLQSVVIPDVSEPEEVDATSRKHLFCAITLNSSA